MWKGGSEVRTVWKEEDGRKGGGSRRKGGERKGRREGGRKGRTITTHAATFVIRLCYLREENETQKPDAGEKLFIQA